MKMDFRRLRQSGKVQRAHTAPHHGSYSIAEHCYGCLTLLLCFHPSPSLRLVKAVAFHDAAELELGDIPSPAKRRYKELSAAYELAERDVLYSLGVDICCSSDEAEWLKAVDLIELLLWAEEQASMGNPEGTAIAGRVTEFLSTVHIPNPLLHFLQTRHDQ